MSNDWQQILFASGLVLLPICTAIFCFLVPKLKLAVVASAFTGITLTFFASSLLVDVFTAQQPIKIMLGGWEPPLGISFLIDGLRAIMLLLSAIVGLATTLYSIFYFYEEHIARRFWPLWWLLFAGINGIFLSSDIFNTYIMLELLGISAVCLISLKDSQKSLNAAYQYLLVGLFGSMMYLLGVALLYRTYGVLDNQLLAEVISSNQSTQLALAFCTIGMLLKTALFPLHFWLPAAHSNAYAPVSAVLSALVVKASFFILFVLWFDIAFAVITPLATTLIGMLGAAAVIYGSFKAFTAPRLKLLVAYSTVAQIGYLFLVFPLMYASPQQAKIAVIYFIVAHGCAKAAMFMSAGAIQQAIGHDRLDSLHGIATKLPMSIFVFAVTGASLIGLPPTGGFIAKWLMLSNAVKQEQWGWVAVLLIGGLLASAYLFRVLNLAFKTDGESNKTTSTEGKLSEIKMLSAVGLSLVTVVIGLNALWLTNLISYVP